MVLEKAFVGSDALVAPDRKGGTSSRQTEFFSFVLFLLPICLGATRASLPTVIGVYFSISNSVASSITVTPSSLALVSLEPAASPATT